MVFMWSDLISSGFISGVVSISSLADAVFPPNLFLTIFLSSRYSKDVESNERCFSSSIFFD